MIVCNCVFVFCFADYRDHNFDKPDGKKAKRRRKSGKISKPDEPARRPLPVREFHVCRETKLLPEVRAGKTGSDK